MSLILTGVLQIKAVLCRSATAAAAARQTSGRTAGPAAQAAAACTQQSTARSGWLRRPRPWRPAMLCGQMSACEPPGADGRLSSHIQVQHPTSCHPRMAPLVFELLASIPALFKAQLHIYIPAGCMGHCCTSATIPVLSGAAIASSKQHLLNFGLLKVADAGSALCRGKTLLAQ